MTRGAEAPRVRSGALAPDDVAQSLDVARSGLSGPKRGAAASTGPNKFDRAATEPRWRASSASNRDPMQIVLLVAAIGGSLYPLKHLRHPGLVALPDAVSRVLGLRHEARPQRRAALQKMMTSRRACAATAAPRSRPSRLRTGDIVALDAGDVVPADGRLLAAATLEVADRR